MSRTLLVLWIIRAVALVIIVLIVTELGMLFFGAHTKAKPKQHWKARIRTSSSANTTWRPSCTARLMNLFIRRCL